jgi:hypothetical protein
MLTICSKFQENKYRKICTLGFHPSFALSQSIHEQREDSKKHCVQKPENICQNKAKDVKMGQGMLGLSQRKRSIYSLKSLLIMLLYLLRN